MSSRMKWILLAAVVVFGGLMGAKAYMGHRMNQYLDNMPVPAATVSSAKAKTATWVTEVTAVGNVTPVQGADLTTEVGGIVEQVYYDSGSDVKAGDVLIALDGDTDRADLKALQAAEKLAQLESNRVKSLWQSRSVSKAEYDSRQSALVQARARVAAQQARVEQKTLRAPFDGRLGIRQVNVGQFVRAGDPMINLQALAKVFVDFTLPEQRYSEVHVGMPVRAKMDALGEQIFTGTVSAVEPIINANTRNFKVRASFDNPEQKLRPGMFARVSLNVGEEKEVVVVPVTSISYKPYGNSVFVISEADTQQDSSQSETGDSAKDKPTLTVSQRFVTIGETKGDLISVVKGLKPGEQVVTSGLLKLRGGASVTINNDVKPDANPNPTPNNS